MLAAIDEGFPSRWRLSQNSCHSPLGIVNVMCCQAQFGKISLFFSIHLSVAFLPHDVQKRDLQLCGTLIDFPQFSHLYSWKPRKEVRQAIILAIFTIMASRMLFLHLLNIAGQWSFIICFIEHPEKNSINFILNRIDRNRGSDKHQCTDK